MAQRHKAHAAAEESPLSVERVEQGLLLLAHIIERDGIVYAPIYEKLERELESLKREESAMERARQRLEANRHLLGQIGIKQRGDHGPRVQLPPVPQAPPTGRLRNASGENQRKSPSGRPGRLAELGLKARK